MLRIAYLGFGFGGSYVLAAAIAFYSLVCLGPLGILLAGGLQALFGPGSGTYRWLQAAAHELGGTAADQVMAQVDSLLANPQSYMTSALSVILLIWSGLRLFETVERSLTGVWPGRLLRGFVMRKLVALLMMLAAGALMACFVLLNAGLAVARGWLGQFPQVSPETLHALRPPLLVAVQLALSVLAFALVYRFVPVRKVPWRVAVRGGVCGAVLWHAASPVFTYVLSHSGQSLVYGGLAGVVVFSLWALLGAWVLLFGAHFAAAYDHVFVQRRCRAEDEAFLNLPKRRGGEESPTQVG